MTSARSIPHLKHLPELIFCALAVVGTSSAQVLEPCELAILTASDAAQGGGAGFGGPVAISGDYLVVGAPLDTSTDLGAGAAYVFRRDGINWVEQAKLLHPDPHGADLFAAAVAIDGDRIVVGAPHDTWFSSGLGSAHVFRRQGGTWSLEQTLVSSGSRDFDWFGASVSISGDYAAVGAPEEGLGGGDAYLFQRQGGTWVEVAAFTGTDTEEHDLFGISVSLDGDLLVIGASEDPDAGDRAGAAYIFRRDREIGWVQEAKLVASDAAPGDFFANSLSLSGEWLAVGASGSDDAGTNSGSAYIFRYNGTTWLEEAKLIASDAAGLDSFGTSISISTNSLVIGATGDDQGGSHSGSAYVFRREGGGWVEDSNLLASDTRTSALFGTSVGVSGNLAIVGTGFHRAAYVFGVYGDCNANAITDVCEIAEGTATDINGTGIPDACENIPAVSRWGLFVLTLVLVVAGTICLQRRHPSRCVLNQRG